MVYPPPQVYLDISALSGILGSVSIACWVVVFSPQIVENFRRSSTDGLSVVFIVVWLLGDVFNILGAVLQGVLPTMIILAIYYTLADLVLLAQCFYYKGFTLSDAPTKPATSTESGHNERTPLLQSSDSPNHARSPAEAERRGSFGSFRDHLRSLDGTHLSPTTPLVPDASAEARPSAPPPSASQGLLFNGVAVVMVCAAGVLGWWLGNSDPVSQEPAYEAIEFSVWGQVFGYICAVLYLGSRIPQLLLNYRRKSTEGISMLFFLFACIGNLTYVLSIVAYDPICRRPGRCAPGERLALYGRYVAVNTSWLVGSFGTLLLDAGVFVQYFVYRNEDFGSDEEGNTAQDEAVESRVVPRRPSSR